MRTQEKLMKHILRRIEGSTAVRLELTGVTPIDFESIALTARPSCRSSLISTASPIQASIAVYARHQLDRCRICLDGLFYRTTFAAEYQHNAATFQNELAVHICDWST